MTLTLRALKGHFAAEASALDLRLTEDRRSPISAASGPRRQTRAQAR